MAIRNVFVFTVYYMAKESYMDYDIEIKSK